MPGLKKTCLVLSIFAVMFLAAGCNLSSGEDGTPDPSLSPTPNLTLTAVFAEAFSDPDSAPTATDIPAVPSATLAPGEEDKSFEDTVPPTSTALAPQSPLIAAETIMPVPLDFTTPEPVEGETVTAEAVEPGIRPGPSVVAEFLDVPPTIDGDIGDWPMTMYLMNYVVRGVEFYADEYDLLGEFKIAWNMEYLFIGVIVRDTRFAQNATGAQLYMGDSIELLLDVDVAGDFDVNTLSDDDYQLGFSPGNLYESGAPEAFLWAPYERAAALEGVHIGGRLTDDGWMIEVAFPWSVTGITPGDGMHLGFLLSVSDNDSITDNAQHSVISFAPQRVLHDPTQWYDLTLINP